MQVWLKHFHTKLTCKVIPSPQRGLTPDIKMDEDKKEVQFPARNSNAFR